MMMARLMAEGDEGRDIRNGLIEALWQDVDFKAQKLGVNILFLKIYFLVHILMVFLSFRIWPPV